MPCGAVVAAAGSSQRMGAIDKVVQPLAGRPVLAWSLEALCAVPEVAEIVVVVGPRNEAAAREIVALFRARRPIALCRGGALRQESVAAGVARLSAGIDLVLIHDAARPLVSPDLIAQGIAAGRALGAAIAAVPVSDTVKRVAADGVVVETPPRAELYAAQTPQVFRRDWLERASAEARARDLVVTDEASLLEAAGLPVHVYPGSPDNLKLTRPIDLVVAEALLRRREEAE